jgi:heterokaryon incompatibility protein (HET)
MAFDGSKCEKTSMPTTGTDFDYRRQPLSSHSSIRLISVQYDSTSNMPSFDLVTFSLDDAPKYSAVSYVWGRSERTHSLRLPGFKDLWITKSLATALEYLPRHCRTGFLWIDQICKSNHSSTVSAKLIPDE